MTRPRVIVATHRPPFPLDNGSRIRTRRLAVGLARHLDVTLVTYAGGPTYDGTSSTRAELEAVLPGVRVELVPYEGRAPRGARRQVLRPRSATWGHYAQAGMRAALHSLAADPAVALLHCEDPGTGLAGAGVNRRPRVFAPHNVEHRIVRDLAAGAGIGERPFLAAEWRKVARHERRLWRESDLCLAVSEVDAATMRAGGAREVAICPNGADPMPLSPWRPPLAGQELRLVFIGSGDFPPYERGLRWFVEEALPRMRTGGRVTLDVIGAPPRRPAAADGVHYLGRVPDVTAYYDRAHALVIPLFEGSGTRLKAVEAAMAGRPVVSTSLGAEGLPLRPGIEYLQADDADGFAAAASQLRTAEPGPLVEAARTAVETMTWDAIADELAERYRTMVR